MKTNKHIEIARSTIVGLSSMSLRSCEAIRELLELHYEHVGVSSVNNINDLEVLAAKQPDLVFLGMKSIPPASDPSQALGGGIQLSDYLEARGITCTGSVGPAIAMDHDKSTAKRIVETAGLKTAASFLAWPGQYQTSEQLPLSFPFFAKPLASGGGAGIGPDSVVHNFGAFVKKVQAIADTCESETLVEEYLTGREFSVAILAGNAGSGFNVMPIELFTDSNVNGDRILGKDVKTANTETASLVKDVGTREAVSELALSAFRTLGARDYGRIDIRLDSSDVPHFLEANLIPSLISGYGSFPKACSMNMNLGYSAMILQIVELGLARNLALNKVEMLDKVKLPFLEKALEPTSLLVAD